jgi:hypothetical protein
MKLKVSKAEIKFKNISWDDYEKIVADGTGWKVKEYAYLMIESIKLPDGFEVEEDGYVNWIKGLDARDGIVLLTKLNMILRDVANSLSDVELGEELGKEVAELLGK